MASTKSIQDRIYRSRLTISYRTNIDGVPVPQQLPLRLLVLGDLTGRKIDEGYARPEARFETREIVSVRKGTKVDRVMREMDITLPIPVATDGGIHSTLADGSTLPGTFARPDGGAGLSASLDGVEEDGTCEVTGQLAFRARTHDNGDLALEGLLPATGKLKISATPTSTTVTLSGNYQLPINDLAAGSPQIAITATGPKVKLAGKQIVLETIQGHKWTGDLDATLDGSILPDPSGLTATCSLQGAISVIIDATSGKSLEFYTNEVALKLTNSAAAGNPPVWQFDPTAIPAVFHGLVLHVQADVPVKDLLKAPPAVGKRGDFTADVNETTAVSLVSDDKTVTIAGTLKGPLKGTVKSAIGGDPVPVELTFTEAGGTTTTLDGKLTIALSASDVEVSVSGQVRSDPALEVAEASPTDDDPITADVDVVKSKDLTKSIMTIGADGALTLEVEGTAHATRTLPITGIGSFTPEALAWGIPEIRRLGIIGMLLAGLRSEINLSTDKRKAIAAWVAEHTSDNWPILRANMESQYPALVLPSGIRAKISGSAAPLGAPQTNARKAQDDWFDKSLPKFLEKLFLSVGLGASPPPKDDVASTLTKPALVMSEPGGPLVFHEHEQGAVQDRERFLNALAILILNGKELNQVTVGTLGDEIKRIEDDIYNLVKAHVTFVLRHESLRNLERNWRGIGELCDEVEDDQVTIDLLDVSPGELTTELLDHKNDIFTSALFKKVYVDEYDRFGGRPFGAMIGLYHFDSSDDDLSCLETMSSIANAAHCPFISSVGPEFFQFQSNGSGGSKWDGFAAVGDVDAYLQLPKFGKWNAIRDSLEAPYLGLTLPGYLLRKPWSSTDNQLGNRVLQLDEVAPADVNDQDQYVWGNSAILFARNMVRSFEQSGWCQYIRGPRGGGLVQGLTVNTIVRHGREEAQSPVEFEIADYRELQFAKAGLIPLVQRKGTAEAAFFSAQAIKRPRDFVSELDTQNSYLVTNLAYTLSITRIAHFVKRMMRDYIGSSLDATYIQSTLQLWLDDYVTTTVNPDDLTLRFFPFKAVTVSVIPKPGPLGWFKGVVSVLPHVQFEGMDVELRLEAALGGAK